MYSIKIMRSYSRSLLSCVFLSLLCLSFSIAAFAADGRVPAIVGIPGPYEWQNSPLDWKVNGNQLSITAGKQTDWFISPFGGEQKDASPRLLFRPAEDFVLSAKVTVQFGSQWDAGVLVLYAGEAQWAKLCFEQTIEQHPAIVSVVTKTLSDDSNSIPIRGNTVYLKVAKSGQAIFFYASEDGEKWMIIRAFSLGKTQNLRVGFSSQSPLGEHCTTTFEDIHYLPKRVDMWSGK
jgi:regulation of enolase protein 1 (concanavalin A-like superfamily)